MLETGFLQRTATVESITYPYQVYVPPEFTPERSWPVILFLHGAGEGGSDGIQQTRVGLGPAIRRYPERFPAVVVFPQSPRGHPWRGPSADLALRGISMGGYGTWRLALQDPHRFVALVPICGGLDSPARRGSVSAERRARPAPATRAAARPRPSGAASPLRARSPRRAGR